MGGGWGMTFCCEQINNVPGAAFSDSADKSVKEFMRVNREIIEESKRLGGSEKTTSKRTLTSVCSGCQQFKLRGWSKADGLIHHINLSMYPAPCQGKCIYCDWKDDTKYMRYNKERHLPYYEKVFGIIEYAQKNNMISHDVTWLIVSGEITIHPLKDRILNLVKGQTAQFCTNAFIFDEQIAENLTANSKSYINVSIDAGTPETWHKVKGVDNFDVVKENLTKYSKYSSREGQVTLKYIILPGINDNHDDYVSVTELMKILKTGPLIISRDSRVKYSISEEERVNLVKAAGRLVAYLYENGMGYNLIEYSHGEREMIIAYANELLKQLSGLPDSPENIDAETFNAVLPETYEFMDMAASEKKFLFGLIRRFKPKNILEIGVSSGGGSGLMLQAIKDIKNPR